MKKHAIILILTGATFLYSQSSASGKIFFNHTTDLIDNGINAFNMKRAYLSYGNKIGDRSENGQTSRLIILYIKNGKVMRRKQSTVFLTHLNMVVPSFFIHHSGLSPKSRVVVHTFVILLKTVTYNPIYPPYVSIMNLRKKKPKMTNIQPFIVDPIKKN